MTAGELIAQLQKFDPSTSVVVAWSEFSDYHGEDIEREKDAESVTLCDRSAERVRWPESSDYIVITAEK